MKRIKLKTAEKRQKTNEAKSTNDLNLEQEN